MTIEELEISKQRVEKALKIRNKIGHINYILTEIRNGTCSNIEFKSPNPSYDPEEMGFGNSTHFITKINAKNLDLSDKYFEDYFSDKLRTFLIELRGNLEAEFAALK